MQCPHLPHIHVYMFHDFHHDGRDGDDDDDDDDDDDGDGDGDDDDDHHDDDDDDADPDADDYDYGKRLQILLYLCMFGQSMGFARKQINKYRSK